MEPIKKPQGQARAFSPKGPVGARSAFPVKAADVAEVAATFVAAGAQNHTKFTHHARLQNKGQ